MLTFKLIYLLVTYSFTTSVLYLVCKMLSKSFDDIIIIQIITCYNYIN